MAVKDKQQIYIRARASRNALTTLVISGSVLLIFSLYVVLKTDPIQMLEGFFMSLCVAGMILGVLKIIEPEHNYILDSQQLFIFHKYGKLPIAWHNIERIGIPHKHYYLDLVPMAYIGIRLYHYEPILDTILPRLAIRWVNEQRGLIPQLIHSESPYLNKEIQFDQFTTKPYISKKQKQYIGTSAYFAVRMVLYRQLVGYDLLLPISTLDRSAEDFVELLKSYVEKSRVER